MSVSFCEHDRRRTVGCCADAVWLVVQMVRMERCSELGATRLPLCPLARQTMRDVTGRTAGTVEVRAGEVRQLLHKSAVGVVDADKSSGDHGRSRGVSAGHAATVPTSARQTL